MNHRDATIRAIYELALSCGQRGLFSGAEVAAALNDIGGMVERIPAATEPDIRGPSELTPARQRWPHWMANLGRGWWQVLLVTPLGIHTMQRRYQDMAHLQAEVEVTHLYPIEMVPQPKAIDWAVMDARLAKETP